MSRLIILVLAGIALVSGCSSHHHCERAAHCHDQSPDSATLAQAESTRGSSLIFDRHPGMYSADQFTYRSDWPSTMGYYRAPEVIFYYERFQDYQGPGWPSNGDYTFRRFNTLRFGQAIR